MGREKGGYRYIGTEAKRYDINKIHKHSLK